MHARSFFFAVSLVALAAGCSGWHMMEPGEHGVLFFVPSECGRDNGCDFDDPIAAGSTLRVEIDGVDSALDTGSFEMISSDPDVIDVVPVDAFASEWQLLAGAPGFAELVVIDEWGFEVDSLAIEVGAIESLRLEHCGGVAAGPRHDDFPNRETWQVSAYDTVSFRVEATEHGRDMMGVLSYGAVFDDELLRALDRDSSPGTGRYTFTAPPGEYDLAITAPGGAPLDVHFVVR